MMKKSSKGAKIGLKVAIGTAVILAGVVAQQLYVFLTFDDEEKKTPTTATQKKKKEIR